MARSPKSEVRTSDHGLRTSGFGLLACVFIILHSSFILATAQAQDAQAQDAQAQDKLDPGFVSPFHAGFRSQYLENLHRTTAQILTGCPECGTFSNGTGAGYLFEAFGEVPFNFLRRLNLMFSVGFVERGGAFGQAITDELPILDPNTNTYVHLTRQHTFTASLKYINVSGGVRFTPLSQYAGYVAARLDAGIPAGRSTSYTQTESILSPQGVTYPQTNTTSLTDGQGTIAGVNTLFGITGTVGWEFPIGPALTASPELSYYVPLNSVSTNYPWHVSSISAGIALRWNEPPKSAPAPPPPPPAPPPIVEREGANAFAPNVSVASLTSQPLHIIETTVTETFPILPYIFFDSASAVVPDRYARLSREETTRFRERDLPHRSLESYYQLLNVIGSRMQANPSATLTINGTTDGREAGDSASVLARTRALSVKQYLSSGWNISPTRLRITTSQTPHNPSSTQYEQGFEENRRVELSSDNDQILAPIVHERFREESAVPDSLPLALSATSKLGLRDWQLSILAHRTTVQELSGNGAPPANILWKPDEGQIEALAKELGPKDSIQLAFRAAALNGSETIDTISVPASKSSNPFELSRLSLIVFDFDQATIDTQNQHMISQFVAKSFYPSSTATIVGSTDALGELVHNQELSTQRADNVRNLILADKPDAHITSTKGIGPSDLLYDNHLPEGRYYCRTVKVEVSTPLESILTGQR